MYKMKGLLGLVVMIGALAITAAPSLAWFSSLSGKSENVVTPLGTSILEGGGGTFECPPTGSEAQYKIQVKNGPTIFEQKAATVGPDQLVNVLKWGTACTATLGAIKAAVTISPCMVHIQQQVKGENKATVSLISECVVKISVCEIKIPKANEKTGENFNLPGTLLTPNGKNVIVEGAASKDVTGIGNGGLCPYTNNKTSSFKTKLEELEESLI